MVFASGVRDAYESELVCPRCRTRFGVNAGYLLCPLCDLENVHVYPRPVYSMKPGSLSELEDRGAPGLLRYRGLLPLGPGGAVSLGEGNTPLLAIHRSGAALGMTRLFIKDESRNPTWSFKDRLAAVAVSRAAQDGADTVVVSSTGNHGASVAAYAAAAGLRCVVLTLASVPLVMKVLMQQYGAEVVALEVPTDRWAVMRAGVEERGWVPMSGYVDPPSGSNPFGVDGYKTIAYELFEQLGGLVPDVIIVPVGYGDSLTGILRGFEDLQQLGVADRLPRLIGAEVHGHYARALGLPGGAVDANSVAFSIAVGGATWQGVDAIQRSGGTAVNVTNDELLQAQGVLARNEGLFVEASCAAPYAALEQLIAGERVDVHETVVLLNTSTGLKDIDLVSRHLPAVPVIEPTLRAFDRAPTR